MFLAVTLVVVSSLGIVVPLATVWVECDYSDVPIFCDPEGNYCGQEYWVISQSGVQWYNASCATRACDNYRMTQFVSWDTFQDYYDDDDSVLFPSSMSDEGFYFYSSIFQDSISNIFIQFGLAATAVGYCVIMFIILNIQVYRIFFAKRPSLETKRANFLMGLNYILAFGFSLAGMILVATTDISQGTRWLSYYPYECTVYMGAPYQGFQVSTYSIAFVLAFYMITRAMALPRATPAAAVAVEHAMSINDASDRTPLFHASAPPTYAATAHGP